MTDTATSVHEKYMAMALQEARDALDAGEFPVGCLLVADGNILARGKRLHSKNATTNELDHAEMVALHNLFNHHPEADRGAITAYSTMEPCLMCYASLLLNGIRNIVYAYEDAMGGGTSIDLTALNPLYREMEVRVTPHVLRDQSLALFKRFFADPKNDYWRDSLLARYTLAQTAGIAP